MPHLEFDDVTIQRLFGHEAAEDEDPSRLREYYFKSTVFSHISNDLPLRILVGHKGTGKSALFKVSMEEDTEKNRLSILIQPNDVMGVGETQGNFLTRIADWSGGLRQIICEKANTILGINLPHMPAEAVDSPLPLLDFLSDRWNKLEEDQYDSGAMQRLLAFLDDPILVVHIDDLDRGWDGTRAGVSRISALLNAVRDMVNQNPGLRFRIAIRSDVYYLVRTSDESTDKIEGSVVWHTWNNHEIFVLLVKRIETFLGRTVDEMALLRMPQNELAKYLSPIMDPRFIGSGHWEQRTHVPCPDVSHKKTSKGPSQTLFTGCTQGLRPRSDENAYAGL